MNSEPSLISRLFTRSLADSLLASAASDRERLLKQRMRECHAKLPSRNEPASECDLHLACELSEFRMPLANGTSFPMGLPYDWYHGVGDGHVGGEAPRFIVPRIAFSNTLARAYQHSGNPAFARALHAYVMDYVSRYWVDSTALPARDNWLCTACRCGTWYDDRFGGLYAALHTPGMLDLFSFADLLGVFRAIDNMMTGLIPNLALGSNWRVHQLANLFTQGFAYPFLRNASEWLALAATGLNEEFEVQFRADGSHEESCIEYGTGTWRVFAEFFALAAETPGTGLRFDAGQMHRCLAYYLSARKPFGLLSPIGDAYEVRSAAALDPSGPPHPAGQPPVWDRVLRRGAECLAKVALTPEAGFILNGLPEPVWQSRFHPDSGYLFLRDGWRVDSLFASLNQGQYANCHCHYGLLGIEVAGYGREFIVDPGVSALDARPHNANLARTRAHSTVCVDGLDQQIAAPVQVSRLFLGKHYDFTVGIYKGGYTRGNPYGPGCTSAGQFDNCFSGNHFRHLLFVKDGYWVLFDALATRPGHVAETRLQFLPNAMRALPGGGYCTGWPAANLALIPLQWDGWTSAILAGEQDPIEGWLPKPGGELIAAPVYKATCPTDQSPLWHGTLLFPYREATLPAVRVTALPTGGAGFGYRIELPGATDYLFFSNSWAPRDITLDEVRTNVAMLHLRFEAGRPVRGCACDGTYLSIREQPVFRAPGTMLAREFSFDHDGKPIACSAWNPRRHRGESGAVS